MKTLILSIFVFLFLGCASNTVNNAVKEPVTPVVIAEYVPAECRADEFRGVGFGAEKTEALNAAHSELAKQIHSSLTVSESYRKSQQVLNGKEALTSNYKSELVVQSKLSNLQDARVLQFDNHANKSVAIVCMSRTDAAKDFIEQQRLFADSLELISNMVLNTDHPKYKNNSWQKTQSLYAKFINVQNLLDSWGIENKYLANELYDKTKEHYKEYCQNTKLYWKAEQENIYSQMTFSKLSQNIKMENAECAGSGISLVYKDEEPKCSFEFGINGCSYASSVFINSCDGKEYAQLKGEVIGAHQKSDFALDKLKTNLEVAEFLEEWKQEIKQWSPLCE